MLNTKAQMRMLWMGPLAMVIFTIGWVPLAGFIPPISPNATALEVVSRYRDNTTGIRVGLMLVMCGGSVLGPFYAAISTQMKRVEGRFPVYAYAQMTLGILVVLLFIIPTFMMQAIALRPYRNIDPEVIRLVNDMAWLPFVGAFGTVSMQMIVFALCVFKDDGTVFPRWLGYFNIWIAISFVPAALEYFFTTGPFAWNGIFVFWIALLGFFGWVVVVFFAVRRSIQGHMEHERQLEAASATTN